MKKLFTIISFALLCFTKITFAQYPGTVFINGHEFSGFEYACANSLATLTVSFTGPNAPDSVVWYDDEFNIITRSFTLVDTPNAQFMLGIIDNGIEYQQDFYCFEDNPIVLTAQLSNYSGTNVSAYGANDGYILLTVQAGATPFAYAWSNSITSKNDTLLTAGNYSVTVTDAHGCTKTLSTTLTQPPQPLTITSVSSPTFNGGYNISKKDERDGKIKVNAVGGLPPYKYYVGGSIHNTPDTVDMLFAKHYSIIVTDQNQSSVSTSITLTEPTKLQLSLTPLNYTVNGKTYQVSCHDCSNGNITGDVSGGVTPYTYAWNTGQTTANISSLSYGYYVLAVTDANGAVVKQEIFLSAPEKEDWSYTGNSGTNETSNFIGTTDNKSLTFRTNNVPALKIEADGTIRSLKDFKLTGSQLNPYNAVYVDQDGIMRVTDPGTTNTCYSLRPNIWFRNTCGTYDNIILFPSYGNLGVGTVDPLERLHVQGMTRWSSALLPNTNYLNIGYSGSSVINSYGSALHINALSQQNVNLCENGGIITIGQCSIPSGLPYRLYVIGGIRTESIKVDVAANVWADYVFNADYKKLSLSDLEKFVYSEKHLPNIPTAKELEKDGVDLVEINAKLLEKVEELTLYIIDINKRLSSLESPTKSE